MKTSSGVVCRRPGTCRARGRRGFPAGDEAHGGCSRGGRIRVVEVEVEQQLQGGGAGAAPLWPATCGGTKSGF